MKNKEIEELLNDMRHSYEIHEEIIKKYNNADKISYPYTINLKQIDLLLSYIEQLENNRDKAIANSTVDNILEFIEDLQKKAELGEHYKHLYSEVKKQKDDGIKYIKSKKAIINTDYIRIFDLFEIDEQGYTEELLRMLGEIDD